MNNDRKHLFHMVDPSPWPFATAMAGFFFTTGLAFYMHRITFGYGLLLISFLLLLFIGFSWFKDIVIEATMFGYHTKVVRMGLKYGFLLFIASEAMLFLDFFEHFFILLYVLQ